MSTSFREQRQNRWTLESDLFVTCNEFLWRLVYCWTSTNSVFNWFLGLFFLTPLLEDSLILRVSKIHPLESFGTCTYVLLDRSLFLFLLHSKNGVQRGNRDTFESILNFLKESCLDYSCLTLYIKINKGTNEQTKQKQEIYDLKFL